MVTEPFSKVFSKFKVSYDASHRKKGLDESKGD